MIFAGVIIMGLGINIVLAAMGVETGFVGSLGIGTIGGGFYLALQGVRDGG